jgi:tryptophan-rich sensory protein
MIAISIFLYIKKTRANPPFLIYGLIGFHLLTNLCWTPVFFSAQSPGWALVDIVLLDLSLLALIILFRQASKSASMLLCPYCAVFALSPQ